MNKKILIAIFGVILLAGAVYLVFAAITRNKQIACTEEAKLCPDGSAVGRTGPNCEFAPCPKDYKNIAYEIEGQTRTLENGTRYFGNDAIGDLNGDGKEDIAFLLTQDSGGSGTFYYVAVALKTADGYQGTNGLLLGDRIAPQTTEIRNGEIIVNYADRKLGEPMTTPPSVGISKYFKVVDNRLVEITTTGTIEGKVTVGPICPVERPDVPCPVPPEAYTSREVILYAANGTTIVKRMHFTAEGTYSFVVPAGTYVLDIPRPAIGGSKDLPKTITVKSGETLEINFSIDTGIR